MLQHNLSQDYRSHTARPLAIVQTPAYRDIFLVIYPFKEAVTIVISDTGGH